MKILFVVLGLAAITALLVLLLRRPRESPDTRSHFGGLPPSFPGFVWPTSTEGRSCTLPTRPSPTAMRPHRMPWIRSGDCHGMD